MSTVFGILLSFVASTVLTFLYALLIWWCDRFEREPFPLLIGSFLWGALPAIAIAAIAGELIGDPLLGAQSALMREVWASSAQAPILEETAKGLALLILLIGWRQEIDGVLDGLVYGAMIGFGFGLTENVFYFIAALESGGWGEWAGVVFLRGVVFGMNHAFFTAFIGAGVGLARSRRRRWSWLLPALGWTLAVATHSAHNLGASLSGHDSAAIMISIVTDAGGVVLLAVMIGLGMRQEKGWLRKELASEIGPVLTRAEYVSLLSIPRRLQALYGAYRAGGWRAMREISAFQQAATELAFLKQKGRDRGWSDPIRRQLSAARQRLADSRPRESRTSPARGE